MPQHIERLATYLWFTVNHNTCFKLPLVFWYYYFTR